MSSLYLFLTHVCEHIQIDTLNMEVWWPPWVSFLRCYLLLFWPKLAQAMLTDQQAQEIYSSLPLQPCNYKLMSTLFNTVFYSNSGDQLQVVLVAKHALIMSEVSDLWAQTMSTHNFAFWEHLWDELQWRCTVQQEVNQ